MSEEYSFPPFEEKFGKFIEKFGIKKMETYNGKDITGLWDMKGGSLTWSLKYLYSAPKIEKIVYGVQSYQDKLMTYTLSIWPLDEYALPIYSFFWAENKNGSYFLADFYPTKDSILDLEYLDYYFEPLRDAYSKALDDFDKKNERDPIWFQPLASTFYITADFGPSTKILQDRIMETGLDYLQVYYDLWEKEEPRDPEYMKDMLIRKKAIRKCLQINDIGGPMLEKAVGKELADLSLEALF